MDNPILKDRAGQVINRWQDWTPPKQTYHWKEGRSAMELAKSWFASGTPQCPTELQALLSTNSRTRDIEITEGYPEYVTALPYGSQANGRNHDMMLRGHTPNEAAVICVEAKVDEPFDKKNWRKVAGG